MGGKRRVFSCLCLLPGGAYRESDVSNACVISPLHSAEMLDRLEYVSSFEAAWSYLDSVLDNENTALASP